MTRLLGRLAVALLAALLAFIGLGRPATAAPHAIAPAAAPAVAAPGITSVSPTTGGTLGGLTVTVNGSGLTGASSVTFGPTAATSVVVNSAGTSLTATTPEGLAGPVDVAVTTAGGTSTLANGFTYTLAPYVSVEETVGPTAGGPVGLDVDPRLVPDITGVTFGGTQAAITDREPDYGYVVVTAPAHAAGTVVVALTTTDGSTTPQTGATPTDRYTYTAAPSITYIDPGAGDPAGGDSVQVHGFNLAGVTGATVGGRAGSVSQVTATTLTLTTPSGTGLAAVALTGATASVAQTGANRTDQFRYRSPLAVTGLYPAGGSTAGGTAVTISGRGFTSASTVVFGSTAAKVTSVGSDGDRIVVTSPAGAVGDTTVTVTTSAGQSLPDSSFAATYSYVTPGPQLGATETTQGPTGGGIVVGIVGSGLSTATKVTFGTVSTTSLYATADGSEVFVNLPAHAAGTVAVSVTTPAGTTAAQTGPLRYDTFTFVSPPKIYTVGDPAASKTTGGQRITITGDYLVGARVLFGGVPGYDVVSDPTGEQGSATSTLEVTAPPHAAGSVQVTVVTAGGTSAPSSTPFVYSANGPGADPVFLLTSSGPTAGGTAVVIESASDLTDASAVQFGSTAASFTTSDGALTAIAPAHAAGTVTVTVTTADGVTRLDPDGGDQYTYTDLPDVTGLSASAGPTAGGTTLRVTGTRLKGTTSVHFGSSSATPTSISSDGTFLTVLVPAHTAGSVEVTATNAAGAEPSAANPVTFTYVDLPEVDGVHGDGPDGTPLAARGPLAGANTVTVDGARLTGATKVLFGGVAGTGVVVSADGTSLTVVAPAHAAGVVRVVVVTPAGSSPTSLNDQGSDSGGLSTFVIPSSLGDLYLFTNHPLVTFLAPLTGPTTGGTTVTVAGQDLTGETSVMFGTTAGLNASVDASGATLTVTSPPHAAGAVLVTVTTPTGTSGPEDGFGGDDAATFTYTNSPQFTAFTPQTSGDTFGPSVGSSVGGYQVDLAGSGLTAATSVTFGGVAATNVTPSADGTSATVTAPAHAAGVVAIVVTTPLGSGSAPFDYVDPPTLTGISPASGPSTGGQQVIVTGTHLAVNPTVELVAADGTVTDAVDVVVDPDGTSLSFTSPGGNGTVDVQVSISGGTDELGQITLTATLSKAFTYLVGFQDSAPVARSAAAGQKMVPPPTPVSRGRSGAKPTAGHLR